FEALARVHGARSQAAVRQICPRRKKILAKQSQKAYFQSCPISHVPVVVCQSVGIRTRGRTAAKGWKNRGSLETRSMRPTLKRPAPLSRDAVEGLPTPCNRDWQPEANRRTPLSTGDAT